MMTRTLLLSFCTQKAHSNAQRVLGLNIHAAFSGVECTDNYNERYTYSRIKASSQCFASPAHTRTIYIYFCGFSNECPTGYTN